MIAKFRPWFIGLLMIPACVLHEQPHNTRYLADYSAFEPADFKQDTLVFRNPTIRATDYERVVIDPVAVYETAPKPIKPSKRPPYDQFAQDVRNHLIASISREYKVVNAPGAGVLRMHFSVEDIKPFRWVRNEQGNRTLVTDTNLKGTKFEVDCRDGATDERIFALATLYSGDNFRAYEHPEQLANVRTAFDEWSAFLQTLVKHSKRVEQAAIEADAAVKRPPFSAYKRSPHNHHLWTYTHRRLKVHSYHRFYVPRPEIHLTERLHDTAIGTDTMDDLQQAFEEQMARVFPGNNKVVNAPGPTILTIHTTIDQIAPFAKSAHAMPQHWGSTTRLAHARLRIECVDPSRKTVVFALIETFKSTSLREAFQEWSRALSTL